jgi:hypothetical protein
MLKSSVVDPPLFGCAYPIEPAKGRTSTSTFISCHHCPPLFTTNKCDVKITWLWTGRGLASSGEYALSAVSSTTAP